MAATYTKMLLARSKYERALARHYCAELEAGRDPAPHATLESIKSAILLATVVSHKRYMRACDVINAIRPAEWAARQAAAQGGAE